MKDRVSIELKDGIADVRLIRADKMNALDNAMFEAIIEAGDRLREMKGDSFGRARTDAGQSVQRADESADGFGKRGHQSGSTVESSSC